MRIQGPYSQHFIFFVTYEKALKARVRDYTRLERLDKNKQSSVLDPLLGVKENEVL
jgi:hypothetical protein